jgi:calcium permeable stress-gated cation channel
VLITLVLAIVFSLFRPYNSLVYAPKLKVADDKHAPPALGKGILAWMKPVLVTKEQDLIVLVGLDATIFLRVLRMCRNIFLAVAVVGCTILIPINVSKSVTPSSQTSVQFIAKITPLNTQGSANWGITICAWIFNLIVCFFLWWNYRAVLRLRRQYYDTQEYQNSLHARSLMVCRIDTTSALLH